MSRPTPEDRDALRLLLQREDLNDWAAEFVKSLQHWRGHWTKEQTVCFNAIRAEVGGEIADDR